MNLPEAFQSKLKMILKEDYDNYLAGFQREYGQTLRVNRLKTEPADLFRRFVLRKQENEPVSPKAVPWCDTGFYVDSQERISMHPYYAAGLYYIQEPSAMAPASFLPVRPGDRVLDLCAAPGGKSTALVGKMQGEGVLISNDISASRCKALLKNIELAGVKNVMVTCENPETLAKYYSEYFDCILVDAPCSGEGMFRRDPSMIKNWSEEEVERYSEIQKEITVQAAKMLRPGGYLMYSTCTYSPEEDEQIVESLLLDGSFDLCELPLFPGVSEGLPEYSASKSEELKKCRRFWNHRVDGEGQFAALLRKNNGDLYAGQTSEQDNRYGHNFDPQSSDLGNNRRGRNSKVTPEFAAFMSDISWKIDPARLFRQQERLFYLPSEDVLRKKIRFVRTGLYLGDCKKNRFEPSQAFAMALKESEYANPFSMTADDERVERYLRCETIQISSEKKVKDGWVLICVDHFPLGWGKAKNGVIKNKYAPGWRR